MRIRRSVGRNALLCLVLLGSVFGLRSQEIVFWSDAGGSADIWVMNADGGGRRNLSRLVHDPGNQFQEYQPKWSPDGKRVAFTSNKSGVNTIWVMEADGSMDFNLTGSTHCEVDPFWSPEGTKIYFARNVEYGNPVGCNSCWYWEIFVHDLVTGIEIRLTSNHFREMTPVVSPDGSEIIYTKSERENDCCNQTDIWIVNADGSDQRLLIGGGDGVYEWGYLWDRFSNRIIYTQDFCSGSNCGEIMSINPDGTSPIRITTNSYYDAPSGLSPDGTKLLFTSNRGGQLDIWVMNIDGSDPRQLTVNAGQNWNADWREANRPPVACCRNLELPAGDQCRVSVTPEDVNDGSFDPDNDLITFSVSPEGPFSIGVHHLTLTVTDSHGESDFCTARLEVKDVAPPDFIALRATPDLLWPPNHKMIEVKIAADLIDICDPDPTYRIIEVHSNEPEEENGDGETEPDWQIIDDHTLLLRAERSGSGEGRVYTITVKALDTSGNSISSKVEVRIPHNK